MTLDRRAILVAAVLVAFRPQRGGATPLSEGVEPMLPWSSFGEQAAAFRPRAARRGLTGDFIPGHPIELTIAAPATEAEVAAVESEVGRSLPSSLRSFFREFTSHFAVSWVMPGLDWIDEQGKVHAGVPLSPPALILSDGEPGPEIGGGQIEIALADIPPRWRSVQASLRRFETKAKQEDDAHKRRFYALRHEFWSRTFPFAGGEEGDVVGIDMTDARQRLLLLSGESADEPGFFLGQDLHAHLDQQLRLGFIGTSLSSLLLFQNDGISAKVAASSLSPFEVAAQRDGLSPPAGVVVDADGPNGRSWRSWLGS